MKKLLFALAISGLLASCALEKRHYRSGFYIFKNGSGESRLQENSKESLPGFSTVGADTSTTARASIAPPAEPAPDIPRKRNVSTKNIPAVTPVKELQKPAPAPAQDKHGMQRTLGWICVSLAVVSLFFLWPLVFFIVPGIIFLVLGYSKGSIDKGGDTEDVVYLKNGSIIRGVIIEQVPGVSLKIKTKDGSVFFYKMEEVDKITKE